MTTMDPELSPLEKALVQTLQAMHHDVIKELRIFRWQTVMLVVFLIGVVSMLKGVDPRIAAAPIKDIMAAPAPAHVVEPAPLTP
jgi:hypothetical protein